MFPLSFKGIDVENLYRDVCKHHRVFFLISNERVPIPFELVHSDIWSPSIIPNILGSRWFASFIDDCTRSRIFLLKQKSDVSMVSVFMYQQFQVKIRIVSLSPYSSNPPLDTCLLRIVHV